MEIFFKYQLQSRELDVLSAFFDSIPNAVAEQSVNLADILNPGTKCYFWTEENNIVTSSAIILERQVSVFKIADIKFGPLASDISQMPAILVAIRNYYLRKGFMELTVQLGIQVSGDSELLEYKLNQQSEVRYYYDRNNWSSISINLKQDEDSIFRSFSKGHKSDIKKASKLSLRVITEISEAELETFTSVYIKMNNARGLSLNENLARETFIKLFRELNEGKNGMFILVADDHSRIIGGIVVLFQNGTARYYKGAADPEFRTIPVLHVAIWEAIRRSRSLGFSHFDLWGYNHFVKEGEQVFNINKFKKGFGGEFTFFPKRMYFIFKPLQKNLFENIKSLYKKVRK